MSYFGGPLGDLVYNRTYSRRKDDGTNETWPETVARVVEGNLSLVAPEYIEPGEREALYDLIYHQKALPAGRHLWMSGVHGRQFLSNCHRAGWGTVTKHASFVFNELMKGGGVGANYSTRYFTEMPIFTTTVKIAIECSKDHPDYNSVAEYCNSVPLYTPGWRVPDSREGWVEALAKVLDAAQGIGPSLVHIDVSDIRPLGAPIRTFGGTAAGPLPLVQLLHEAERLSRLIVGQGFSPLLLMDLDHAIASCVVSGNVRRSARMSILHWDDPYIWEFLSCKKDPTRHWSTNISVEVDQGFFDGLQINDSLANQVLDAVVAGMLENGEPGIYNARLASVGERADVGSTNPCGELALEEWENCNLAHVNVASMGQRDRLAAFRWMARFAVRATFGDFEDPDQQAVVRRNRRIGIGFFGLQEMCAKHGWKLSRVRDTLLPRYLIEWKREVQFAARQYAEKLGIPVPIKCTTVAPTGTVAKLAGTTEGMHPVYAKWYVRRVRFAENDPQVEMLRTRYDVEPCQYTAGTVVVSIPTQDAVVSAANPSLIEDASELDPNMAMNLQALIQSHYADNAISHTINIPPDTLKPWQLKGMLRFWLPELKGITVMVDETRPQAPYTRITQDEYLRLSAAPSGAFKYTPAPEESDCLTGACPVR